MLFKYTACRCARGVFVTGAVSTVEPAFKDASKVLRSVLSDKSSILQKGAAEVRKIAAQIDYKLSWQWLQGSLYAMYGLHLATEHVGH